jgi:hypothetical protein
MTEVIVTMRDVRAVKGCSRGARAFCLKHGINWTEFLEKGVDGQVLLDTGDAQAAHLVEVARGRK